MGGRSNSYNFVPVSDVPRAPSALCPVKTSGDFPYDVGRELFLLLRDRMRLFRTSTRDFDDDTLRAIKEDLGQVYVDVSSKLAPDDFATDLRKIRLLDECHACQQRSVCGGCWQGTKLSTFARDDERLRALLTTLKGRILDVGCGEGPYAAEIAPQVTAGDASYLGVDPDRARIDLLRSRHPWARYHVGTVSELAATEPPPRFDHVLVLRSYNHLPDPGVVLRAATSMLESGGSLVVADNVAFGLIRTAEHAARAEQGPGELEHYRNDSSHDAHALLSELPLRLRERHDVGPETSNQWLLRYEKTSEGRP